MALWLCGAFHLPSVFRVSVHDTYFQLPVPLHRPAELRHFQQALGVGNDEDSVETGPNSADFVNQLRYIDGGGLPDGSAADTLPDNHSREPRTLLTFSLRSASSSSDRRMMIGFVLLRMDSPFSGVIGVEPLVKRVL